MIIAVVDHYWAFLFNYYTSLVPQLVEGNIHLSIWSLEGTAVPTGSPSIEQFPAQAHREHFLPDIPVESAGFWGTYIFIGFAEYVPYALRNTNRFIEKSLFVCLPGTRKLLRLNCEIVKRDVSPWFEHNGSKNLITATKTVEIVSPTLWTSIFLKLETALAIIK